MYKLGIGPGRETQARLASMVFPGTSTFAPNDTTKCKCYLPGTTYKLLWFLYFSCTFMVLPHLHWLELFYGITVGTVYSTLPCLSFTNRSLRPDVILPWTRPRVRFRTRHSGFRTRHSFFRRLGRSDMLRSSRFGSRSFEFSPVLSTQDSLSGAIQYGSGWHSYIDTTDPLRYFRALRTLSTPDVLRTGTRLRLQRHLQSALLAATNLSMDLRTSTTTSSSWHYAPLPLVTSILVLWRTLYEKNWFILHHKPMSFQL